MIDMLPDDEAVIAGKDGRDAVMIDLARYIQSHSDERLTLAELSDRFGLSASRLQRRFKAAFGVTPKTFQSIVRSQQLKGALRDGDDVTGAIFSAGYGSTSRVYGEAARHIGMTPSAYRAGGRGETIWYATRESALGPLVMGATERGVCFAQFGTSKQDLVAQLANEFPNAVLRESPAEHGIELDDWIDALDDTLRRAAPSPALPVDLRGTAFQMQVWQFLLSVPDGDVISYAELATGIGRPKAARAAASACAANRIAVLVPCHRVLRGDGRLGGYRWGIERKRALLDAERARRNQPHD